MWENKTSEIVLKLLIKFEPDLGNVFKPQFSKYMGFGVKNGHKWSKTSVFTLSAHFFKNLIPKALIF